MKYEAIIVLSSIVAGITISGCLGQQAPSPASNDTMIGVLVPLTGDWSSKG